MTREQTTVQHRIEGVASTAAARRERLLQIDRLHAAWSLAIQDYLTVLGKHAWGQCNYQIVDDVDPDAHWKEYQVMELEWHERTDRYQVRNQDDWYECEYRLGYRLRIGVQDDHYTLGNTPLTENSLRQWFVETIEQSCPQCVEERLVRIY